MESSVFMLKPIVDRFYEEARIYKERIEFLEKKVELLTKQLADGGKKSTEVVTIGEDDDVYADEALAPPAASLAPTKEENHVVHIETATTSQEESKQINISDFKDRKAYMKEYQRLYRKKKKELEKNS
jgi:hypothetical protein